ncbi:VOC family protein [Rhodococcus sp. LB1]|uniref:VOC family protein n=1 Tax=Rhodococcus sp. LB1 TaxID=1807499 RepID=UPI00077ACD08|nr:VOC family protein [Rhodococcus sp. LB1]KXX54204.1 hypothetical protein AZG88_25090 [Rhodococcus sp. LB1]
MKPAPRVNHIGIVVADMDSAVAFFENVLGIEVPQVIDLGPAVGRVAMAPCGPVEIELIDYADPARRAKHLGNEQARIEHVAFDVEDAESSYEQLESAGVGFAGPLKTRPDCTTFFTDPATSHGLMFQFREPH